MSWLCHHDKRRKLKINRRFVVGPDWIHAWTEHWRNQFACTYSTHILSIYFNPKTISYLIDILITATTKFPAAYMHSDYKWPKPTKPKWENKTTVRITTLWLARERNKLFFVFTCIPTEINFWVLEMIIIEEKGGGGCKFENSPKIQRLHCQRRWKKNLKETHLRNHLKFNGSLKRKPKKRAIISVFVQKMKKQSKEKRKKERKKPLSGSLFLYSWSVIWF